MSVQAPATEKTEKTERPWPPSQGEWTYVQTMEVYELTGARSAMLGTWGPGEVTRSEVLAGLEVAVDDVFAEPVRAARQ